MGVRASEHVSLVLIHFNSFDRRWICCGWERERERKKKQGAHVHY